jgi:hypothetical protein
MIVTSMRELVRDARRHARIALRSGGDTATRSAGKSQ